jgi:hypothetical protein
MPRNAERERERKRDSHAKNKINLIKTDSFAFLRNEQNINKLTKHPILEATEK